MTRLKPPAVDGAELLTRLRDIIRTYVILPTVESLDAVTLWIAATHALPAWNCAPRLVIRAPLKRCGKSRLLDLVEAASHNPMMTVNASLAAIIRSVAADNPPTLLIDEYDTIFGPAVAGAAEDLRGLLNAGHSRNRPVSRYDANTRQVEKLETFAMVAMAGIGAAPDTIEDRAVIVHMRRRAGREKVSPWRVMRDRPLVAAIARELSAWLAPHIDALREAEPVMPVEDRDADTWEPLIAIGDLAGGDWPVRARTAAVTLTGAREANTVTGDSVALLADCHAVFAAAGGPPALPTSFLIERLKAMDDAPWSDINPHKLGVMLREFEIRSAGNVRFMTGQAKGYTRASFTDAWHRYCGLDEPSRAPSAEKASQPSQPSSETGRSPEWDGWQPSHNSNRPRPDQQWDGWDGYFEEGAQTPDGTVGSRDHLRAVPPLPDEATGTD